MSEPIPEPRPKRKIRLSISRRRLVEFTVVVLGVLVALGLENLVQEARYRGDARDLERAIISDLAEAVEQSTERQAVKACLARQLQTLLHRVDGNTVDLTDEFAVPRSAFPYVLSQGYRSPTRVWNTASFDRALGSEAFKRIPNGRAANYAALFAQIELQDEFSQMEFLAASRLAPLALHQPNIDAQVRAEALKDIANVDRIQALLAIGSEQIIEATLSVPEVGEAVRRDLIGSSNREVIEASKAAIRTTYGDCVDLTVYDRLNTPATS